MSWGVSGRVEGGGRGRLTTATTAAARFGCNIVVGDWIWPAYRRRNVVFVRRTTGPILTPTHR